MAETRLWLILFVLVIAIHRASTRSNPLKGAKQLPGPSGLPLVGNLLEFPSSFAWLKFKEWSHRFGPIYRLTVLGNTLIIVSEQRIADELLTVRGANYSDRGALHMLSLITRGGDLVGSPLGDYWRKGRRFATAMLTPANLRTLEFLLAQEAAKMVVDMVKDSSKYEFLYERVSTVVSIRQNYGKTLIEEKDIAYHIDQIMAHNHHIERVGAPGAYMVDIIPTLRHLPEALAPFKQEAKAIYERESAYFFGLLQDAIDKHAKGIVESPESLATFWLKDKDKWGLSFEEAGYVLGTMFGGATGTTSGTMRSFTLAMCHHPEWMEKLNDELDEIVGPDRPPSYDDYPNLPTVRAVIKETLRWRPVVVTNVPHRVVQDDVFEGYHIPKGALVFANQWAIHRDPIQYPDGETFNPARWLNTSFPTFKEPSDLHPNIKRYSAFGFGRRICPGFDLAERSLFMQVSTMAWACRITKKSINHEEIPVPYYDYTQGAQSFPKPFVFDVIPRFTERIEMLLQSRQGADGITACYAPHD